MGHTKQYQNLDEKRTQREAINDLIAYMGKRRARVLMKWARARPNDEATFESFAFYAGMAGVEGFPVQALWTHIQEA